MIQQISDLQAAVATLTTQVAASAANSRALKDALDAALAALAQAQANALSDADKAALADAVSKIQSASQVLADVTATTNPSN